MKNLLDFDELNNIVPRLEELSYTDTDGKRRMDKDECIDIVLDALIVAYMYGTDAANEMLGSDYLPSTDAARKSIYKETAGETFSDRVSEYAAAADIESIKRVAETEAHRVLNDGILDTGREYVADGARVSRGALPPDIYKTWDTMRDDRVRESHDYLLGSTVPLDAEFYTYDGDHAAAPGGFENAENNVNCRCWVVLSKK